MSERRVRQKPKEEQVQAAEPLHVKYRPKKLNEVVGQAAVVKSLESVLKDKSAPHAFLFTGPSGCGKTTLARIVGNSMGIEGANVLELDAATNNGVDDMRAITAILQYQGFGDSPRKLIILDECHQLTKQAWQSILKAVEEPPPHIYFAFCTTEPGKVPETIRTRCNNYQLQPVKLDPLVDLLEGVAQEEGYDVPDSLLVRIAKASGGSPRMALVKLATVANVQDEESVALLLADPGENPEVIELARMLIQGSLTWDRLCKTLKDLPEGNPESVRIVVTCYVAAVLMNSKKESETLRMLDMLECFSKPCNQSDKWAPLLIAFGRYIYP